MLISLGFFFVSAAAMGVFLGTVVQFLDLGFDHYYGVLGVGAAICGVLLGPVMGLIIRSAAIWIVLSIAAMFAAFYFGYHSVYGASWTFLVLTTFLVLPFAFWGNAVTAINKGKRFSRVGLVVVATGIVAGLFLSVRVVELKGHLSASWLLSPALLSVSLSLLYLRKNLLLVCSAIMAAAALFWGMNTIQMRDFIQWNDNSGRVTKQISAALAEELDMKVESTTWQSGMRVDRMVTKRSLRDGFGWWLVNGATAVTDIPAADDHPDAWWQKHFPLLRYPLQLAGTKRFLSVGPLTGPATMMARQLGWKTSSIDYVTGEAAGYPQKSDEIFDLIMLSIPQPVAGPWVGVNSQDEALLTQEMLRWYWSQVSENGILSITARDEALFARALLSVWSLIVPAGDQPVSGLGDHIRVLRLNALAPFKGNYQYLLMASRAGFSDEMIGGLAKLLSTTPVEQLVYGAPVKNGAFRAFNPYVSVTLDEATSYFARYFGQKFGRPVKMSRSTIDQPGFFQLTSRMHPFLEALLTLCLAMMIYSVMFSNPAMRNINCDVMRDRPSTAVLLACVFVSASVAALLWVLPLHYAAIVSGRALPTVFMIGSFGLLGAMAAVLSPDSGVNSLKRTLVMVILSESVLPLGVILCWLVISWISVAVSQAVAILVGLYGISALTGFAFVRLHQRILSGLACLYPEAQPWGWFLAGIGVLVGSLLSFFLCYELGLRWLITGMAAATVAVVLIVGWIHQALIVSTVARRRPAAAV